MVNPLDRHENLPGVRVEYENGNLYSDQQNINANTKSILILGTAIDGPVGEPVSVQAIGGPKAAERLFGGMLQKKEVETGQPDPNTGAPVTQTVKVPHEGTLIRSMYEVLAAGNEDVRLMRVSGNQAKTELVVHDIEKALEQTLGVSGGNVSFSKRIEFGDTGRLSTSPIQHIREKREDGTLVKEFAGAVAIQNAVLSVDATSGQETVFFKPNVFRPGNKIEVQFNFNKRTYYEVLRSDEDGRLTQDPSKPNYFGSEHSFFSDDVASGHTINVYVNGIGIPQMSPNGQWLWRPGKEDPSISNPLTDAYTALEYEQGGIRFTEAYQVEVANGTYPELNSSAEVVADYFYYDEVALPTNNEYVVPGEDATYTLDYLPKQEGFSVFYEIAGQKYELTPRSTENPNGDFSMIFPGEGSSVNTRVVIKAGSVPVGVTLKASYATNQTTSVNPKIIVEAAYAGEDYAKVKDISNPDSIEGIAIDIRHDITAEDPSGKEKIIHFIKPVNKRQSVRDEFIEYRTRDLKGITNIGEFANFVNNDSRNNIVRLVVPEGSTVPMQGIAATNGLVYLGQKYNDALGEYETFVDLDKKVDDPKRYPWVGSNGFFDRNSLTSMMELYEVLGGVFEPNPTAYDEYRLVKQGVYNKIENYPVDSIVMAEAYINTPIGRETYGTNGQIVVVEDKFKNFATQLAQHCAVATAKVRETIGFIGVEPVRNASLLSIQEYIEELASSKVNDHYLYNDSTHEHILNDEGDLIDIGHYINVVFGPEVGLVNDKLGNYITNGVSIYAGLNSVLPAEVATTNKEISVHGLRYHLSESQHNLLAGARFVTFDERIATNGTRQIKVKDGVTAGQPNSDYTRLSTVNITHFTSQIVRSVAEPFIGMPNGLAQQNSMSTEIQAGLDRLKENGVLQDFKFTIFTSPNEKVLGNAFITLEIVPEFETRRIHTSVALRTSL
ncbi:hypothetical protein [Oceanobacillus profundus]|uniref:Uncharacterized protein n=1 Tax=Oceanobacillus profundus TaxID=372463 RepID=A0A417YGR5_9BACI|nr:hypothetical protein [Oceanobacillus profundus]MBR2246179.1 hypothetical protein [Bacilli bacterium]MBR3119849.1 hypothetical protein [Oceanobacillus sp.]RHW31993.1 hypothetical protein D1B32_12205 [Oceanobacillus profundus]